MLKGTATSLKELPEAEAGRIWATKQIMRDIPAGSVVKNLPSNAEDTGSTPGWETKIPHAMGQLISLGTPTTELEHLNCTQTPKRDINKLLLFSHYVVSNSLWPQGLQHTRLPCSSLSPGACSNSYPLSQWWHPTSHPRLPLLILPSIFPSIRVFSNESALHIRWPKY